MSLDSLSNSIMNYGTDGLGIPLLSSVTAETTQQLVEMNRNNPTTRRDNKNTRATFSYRELHSTTLIIY